MLTRIWSLARFEGGHIKRLAVLETLQSLSYLPFYAGVGILIDKILQNNHLSSFEKGRWLAVYAVANLLLWPVHAWFTVKAFSSGQQLIRSTIARIRRLLVDHVQRLSISFFTRRGAGALASQVTTDLNRVETFLSSIASGFVSSVAIAIGAGFWMFVLDWRLGTITVVSIPLQLWFIRRTSGRLEKQSQRVQQYNEDFAAKVVEFIAGMRAIKALGHEEMTAAQLGASIERIRTSGLDASVSMRWVAIGFQMIGEFLGLMIWCLGGYFYISGELKLGSLVAFTTLLSFVRQGFNASFSTYDTWVQARPSLEAILRILDSDELEGYRQVSLAKAITGAIQLEDVSFHYPGSQGRLVLSHLYLNIPAGQRIGIVGATGAGKSTFLDLLMGFYSPTGGRLLYDNQTLAEIGVTNLRRKTAIMSQDSFLWNTTIRENIRMGKAEAADDEVEQAARQAQAHSFIETLKEGYNTIVGERGGRLSGGQRQRIALARLFLRNPQIVVLDEPTSALDVETEVKLQRDLDSFCSSRTTLVVAHRLSTLRSVNRVLVFSEGRIVEDDSPDVLLAREDSHFRRLHELQSGTLSNR